MAEAFDSLADAARSSFPAEFCRVVAMREHGDMSYVLFDTRPSGQPYLYGVDYERIDGHWMEGGSGDRPGWSRVRRESELGILTDWDEARPRADRVRIEFEGEIREEAVNEGAYLAVWWDVPHPDTWPIATAFRINGEWVRAPQWP